MMKARWQISLSMVLGLWVAGARADDAGWRPVGTTPTPEVVASSQAPAVSLGRPVAVGSSANASATAAAVSLLDPRVAPVSYSPADQPPPIIVRAQAPDVPPPVTSTGPIPPPGGGPPPGVPVA